MSVRQFIQSLIDDLTDCLQRTTNPSSAAETPFLVERACMPALQGNKQLIVGIFTPNGSDGILPVIVPMSTPCGQVCPHYKEENHE